MKAVVLRVSQAFVRVNGDVVGEIGIGLLVLAAAHRNDTEREALKLADRVLGLRIFNDEAGKMNLALAAVGGSVLAVSNFTVYGDTSRNRRPSFGSAAPYERGRELFEAFTVALRQGGCPVAQGIFGADMKVHTVNDGPVTVIVEAPPEE